MGSRKQTVAASSADEPAIHFDDFELNAANFSLRNAGQTVHTEPLVFDFLAYIIRHRDRVVSRDELIEKLWQGRFVSDATVAGCIKSARKALGDTGDKQAYIKTIRGRGVQFVGTISAPNEIASKSQSIGNRIPTSTSSLVVLPFQVFGDSDKLDPLADGVVENLTTVLTRVPLLSLASRTSSFALKGQALSAQAVGQQLGVRYMLEGSLQLIGGTVRTNVQLIETENGFHMWAQQFECPDDGDVIQALMHDILPRLEPRLTRAVFKDLSGIEGDLSAGQLLLQAVSLLSSKGWHQRTFAETAELLREAIQREPDLALAHAHLALVLGLGHRVGLVERSNSIVTETLKEAEAALDLDSLDSNVVGTAACAIADIGQPERAVPLLKNAIDLNPSNGQAWTALGSAYALLEQFPKSLDALKHGIAISPMDARLAVWRAVHALILLQTGQGSEARAVAEIGCQNDDKNYLPRVSLAAAMIADQDTAGARRALKEARRIKPDLSEEEVSHFVGRRLGRVLGSIF